MYRYIDDDELEIKQLDNIKLIHFYNLVNVNNNIDNLSNIVALAVYYGENKQLNYCSMDKHFTLLVNKVFEVYDTCNYKNKIIIDKNTRDILERGQLDAEDELLALYKDKDGQDLPYIYTNNFRHYIIDSMVKYYLEQIATLKGSKIQFNE